MIRSRILKNTFLAFQVVTLTAGALFCSGCGSNNNAGGFNGGGSSTGINLNYSLNSTPSFMAVPVSSYISESKGKVDSVHVVMNFNLKLFDNELGSVASSYKGFLVTSDVVIAGSTKVEVGTGLAKVGAYREVQGVLHTSFSIRLKAGSKLPFLTRSNEYLYPRGLSYSTEISLTSKVEASYLSTQLDAQGTITGSLQWSTESLSITNLSQYANWVNDNKEVSSSSAKAEKRVTDGVALRDYAIQNGVYSTDYYCYSDSYLVQGNEFYYGLNYIPSVDNLQLTASWYGYFPDGYLMLVYFVWKRTDVANNIIVITLTDALNGGMAMTAFYVENYILLEFPQADSNSGVPGDIAENDLGIVDFQKYIHDAIELIKESFRHTEELLNKIDPGTKLW